MPAGEHEDDEIAVGKARRGDRDAFRELVERHARPLFRLAWRMTGNEMDAEDMVQETFLKAWKQLGRFDGRASFATWLHRICVNCSVDLLRARTRKREDAEGGEDRLGKIAAEAPSPERLALSSEVAAMLGPALNELSGMERTAFILRHYEGLRMEDIAEALGVRSGAAKHSVFRAVQKLRRALEPAVSVAK